LFERICPGRRGISTKSSHDGVKVGLSTEDSLFIRDDDEFHIAFPLGLHDNRARPPLDNLFRLDLPLRLDRGGTR
jgi:hypothetical protein